MEHRLDRELTTGSGFHKGSPWEALLEGCAERYFALVRVPLM